MLALRVKLQAVMRLAEEGGDEKAESKRRCLFRVNLAPLFHEGGPS